jgi:hypothetical protein
MFVGLGKMVLDSLLFRWDRMETSGLDISFILFLDRSFAMLTLCLHPRQSKPHSGHYLDRYLTAARRSSLQHGSPVPYPGSHLWVSKAMRSLDSTAPSAQLTRRKVVFLQSRQAGDPVPRLNRNALLVVARELVGRLHLLV